MKRFLYLSAIILALIFAASCASTQSADNDSYTYAGFKNIYPAVHYAIKEWKGISFNKSSRTVHSLDAVTINGIQIMEGLRVFEFSLNITNENNVITYRFSKFKSRSITNETWINETGFRQAGTSRSFTEYFNAEMPKVLENDDLYYRMLKEVLVSQGSTEAQAAAEAERLRKEEAGYSR